LVFWIVPLVLIEELANETWNRKVTIGKLPIIVSSMFFIWIIIISTSIYWRKTIYFEGVNPFILIRQSLYALNPILLISLIPLIRKSQRRKFITFSLILSLGLFSSLMIPKIFNNTDVGQYLNNTTASTSAFLSNLFLDSQIQVNKNYISIDKANIVVGSGCSSTPQIMIALFTTLVFYICCKIESKKLTFFYILFVILIAFIINSIRISILSYMVLLEKTEAFNFWHHGGGSLIFSFLVMIITCSSYYYIWSKENPVEKNNR